MKGTRLALGLWAALAAGCATVKLAPQPEPQTLGGPTVTMLRNGMRVVVGHDARQPLAAVSLVVGVGSAQDPPERPGLAELVARLRSRARTRDGHARDLYLQSLGATSGYDVGLDETSFRTLARRELWSQLLAAELDLLADPLVGVEEDDLRAELALFADPATDPRGRGRGLERLLEALFPAEDSYGGDRIAQRLAGVTLAEVRAFATRYYRASNATLYVDGDLPAGADRRVISTPESRGLDGGPLRSPLPRGSTLPMQVKAGGLVVQRQPAPVDVPELWIGWALPSAYGPQAALVELATSAIGHLLFNDRLRSDDANILSIDVFTVRGARATILACRVNLASKSDPDRAAKAVAANVSEEWSVLASVTSKDLRATNVHRAALEERTLQDRAARWPLEVHYVNDPRFTLNALRASIDEVDASVAFDFVQSHLTPDLARAVFLQPAAQKTTAPPGAPEPGTDDGRWPESPAPAPPTAAALPARTTVQSRTLANGLTAIVAPNDGFPLTTVVVGFHGGDATDAPPGASHVVRASGVFTSGNLCAGAHWCSDVVNRDVTATAFSLERSLVPPLLERLGVSQTFGWVQWPDDPKAFRLREHFRNWEASPAVRSGGALRAALYPGTRWGRAPRLSDLEAITQKDATAWSEAHRAARNGAVVIVGDVPADLVFQAVDAELSSWDAGSPTTGDLQPLPPGHPEPLVLVGKTPSVTGASVQFGCRLPPVAAGDVVWREVLAQAVERTLDRRLRRGLALTAAVSVSHGAGLGGTSQLTGGFEVANVSLPRAVEELQSTFAHLKEGRWTGSADADARLDLELRGYETTWIVGGASSTAVASRLLHRWSLQWPLDDRADVAAALAAPSTERLAELARTCQQTAVISTATDPSAPAPRLSPSASAQAGREASQRMASSSAQ